MKKIATVLFLAIMITGCSSYITEETKIYTVEQYAVHDIGIEVWVKDAPADGYFFEYDSGTIYLCDEDKSRIIEIYTVVDNMRYLKCRYLYLAKEDYNSEKM